MKVTFEFNLPEDQLDLDVHIEANELYSALFEITHNLKRKWKHSDKDPSFDEVFDAIYEITKDIKCL
jgi:hypothetical protein